MTARGPRGAMTALFIFLAAAGVRAESTPPEWEVLKTGRVVAGEVFTARPDGRHSTDVVVKAWIKAPRQEVWKTLRDYDRFAEFFPKVRDVHTVKREGESYWVYYRTEVLWVTVVYHLKLTAIKPFRRIEFETAPELPNDLKEVRGFWAFDDAPGGLGTVLTYSVQVDTGIPAPEFLARKLSKPGLVEVVENARRRVESGNSWRKPEGS